MPYSSCAAIVEQGVNHRFERQHDCTKSIIVILYCILFFLIFRGPLHPSSTARYYPLLLDGDRLLIYYIYFYGSFSGLQFHGRIRRQNKTSYYVPILLAPCALGINLQEIPVEIPENHSHRWSTGKDLRLIIRDNIRLWKVGVLPTTIGS